LSELNHEVSDFSNKSSRSRSTSSDVSESESESMGSLVGTAESNSVEMCETSGTVRSEFHGSQFGSTSLVGTSEGSEFFSVSSSHSSVVGSVSASHGSHLFGKGSAFSFEMPHPSGVGLKSSSQLSDVMSVSGSEGLHPSGVGLMVSSQLSGEMSVFASESSRNSVGARMFGFEGSHLSSVDSLASGLELNEASHESGVLCASSSGGFSSSSDTNTSSMEVSSSTLSRGSSSGATSFHASGMSGSSSDNSLDTGIVCGTFGAVGLESYRSKGVSISLGLESGFVSANSGGTFSAVGSSSLGLVVIPFRFDGSIVVDGCESPVVGSSPVGMMDLGLQNYDLMGVGSQLSDTDTSEMSNASLVSSDSSSSGMGSGTDGLDVVMPDSLSYSGSVPQSVVLCLFLGGPVSPVVEMSEVENSAHVLSVAVDSLDSARAASLHVSVAPLVSAAVVSLASRNTSDVSARSQASVPVEDVASVEQLVVSFSITCTPTLPLTVEVMDGSSLDLKLFPRYVGSVGSVGKASKVLALTRVVVPGVGNSGEYDEADDG